MNVQTGHTLPVRWESREGEHLHTDAYYRAQWSSYARRRWLALIFLYSWAPVASCLFLYSRMLVHRPILFSIVIVLWLALAIGLVYWAGEFRCPRCRRRYAALGHSKGDINLTRGIFDQICTNCKLRKFESIRTR